MSAYAVLISSAGAFVALLAVSAYCRLKSVVERWSEPAKHPVQAAHMDKNKNGTKAKSREHVKYPTTSAPITEEPATQSTETSTETPVDPEVSINPLTLYLSDDVDFSLYRNICVVGPQNSGKTTLLQFLRVVISTFVRGDVSMEQLEADNFALLRDMWNEECKTLQGLNKPTAEDDRRDPTPFEIPKAYVMLWDMPGGGTTLNPAEGYVARMGLKHMSSVLVVTGTSDTEVTSKTVEALHAAGVPMIMVQTHFDVLVSNEKKHKKAEARNANAPGKFEWKYEHTYSVIAQRREYLKEKYSLTASDDVMCVNLLLQPEEDEDANEFEKDPFELMELVLGVVDIVEQAHN